MIGTDITGTAALGNSGPGISLTDSGDNTIGGTAPGTANVISANDGDRHFHATSEIFGDNLIQGNLIGTDITGTVAWATPPTASTFRRVGQHRRRHHRSAANVIAANGQDGITIGDVPRQQRPDRRELHRHRHRPGQGTRQRRPSGSTCRTPSNTIGGTVEGAGNVIAFNEQAGVAVVDNFNGPTTGVEILSNSIFANQGLGIDLGDDGVTPNHPGGPILGTQ